jgi:hypothetical protein
VSGRRVDQREEVTSEERWPARKKEGSKLRALADNGDDAAGRDVTIAGGGKE